MYEEGSGISSTGHLHSAPSFPKNKFQYFLYQLHYINIMTEAVDSSTTLASERGRDPYLFSHRETLECVLKSKCIPCLYKLFPDGVRDEWLRRIASEATGSNMEDAEKLFNDLKYPKNQRPEQCPRSKVDPERSVLNLYTGLLLPESSTTDDDKLSILTVGDGDFSFSLSIANLLLNKKNETLNKTIELTMTSHESKRSVLDTYKPYVNQTLTELTNLGAIVLHDVDATNLRNTEELQKLKKKRKHHENNENHENSVKMKRYNVIIWNFPCISLPAGADGQSKELIANKQLLAGFFQNIHSCMKKGHSEVHLTHKTIEPFSWWGVKEIAKENGFDFAYAIAFDK